MKPRFTAEFGGKEISGKKTTIQEKSVVNRDVVNRCAVNRGFTVPILKDGIEMCVLM